MAALAPVYIFSSDDPLLKNERSAEVVAQARQALPDADFMIFTHSDFQSTGEANLQRLENELIDPGLFGGDRIIKIYLRELNKTAVAVLMLLAQRLRQGVIVVIDLPRIQASFGKLKPKQYERPSAGSKGNGRKSAGEKKASLKTLSENAIAYLLGCGAVLQIMYPPEGDQLIGWITGRAKKYQLSCPRECADYIAACSEGNLTGIDQTLALIGMTSPRATLSIELLDQTLTQDSRFSGYEVAEALLSGNAVRALNVLRSCTENSGPIVESLGQIIGSLDTAISAIPKAREAHLERMQSYKDRAFFFMSLGLKTLGIQKAVQKAAMPAPQGMPDVLIEYLTKELAHASILWSSFRSNEALQALQNMCTAVANFGVMKLEALRHE